MEDSQRKKYSTINKIYIGEWENAAGGKVADLSLGHILTASFVAFSQPIPGKVKDKVLIEANENVCKELNQWNRDVGQRQTNVPFNDVRMRRPLRALTESIAGPYLDKKSKSYDNRIEKTCNCLVWNWGRLWMGLE